MNKVLTLDRALSLPLIRQKILLKAGRILILILSQLRIDQRQVSLLHISVENASTEFVIVLLLLLSLPVLILAATHLTDDAHETFPCIKFVEFRLFKRVAIFALNVC